MTAYFRLAADCYFVAGAKDMAVYDVSRGRLLLLDDRAAQVIQRFEANMPLDDPWFTAADQRFVEELRAMEFGTLEGNPVFVDRMLAHSLRLSSAWNDPPPLRRLDWTITNRCDLSCDVCAPGSRHRIFQACVACARRRAVCADRGETPSADVIVANLSDIGGTLLHIRGGNPLLEWNTLQKFAEAASRSSDVKLLVTTPGVGVPAEKVAAWCSDYRVRLNIVLFSLYPAKTHAVCGQDILAGQLALADALLGRELSFSVTFMLTERTYGERTQIRRFTNERWKLRPIFARAYPEVETSTPDGGSGGVECKRLVPPGSAETFEARGGPIQCLYGVCEVGLDGNLYPCAGVDSRCGPILAAAPLLSITSGALDTFWTLTRREIEPCRRCALRYACLDCIGTMKMATNGNYRAVSSCHFDPDGDIRAWYVPWEHSGSIYRAALSNDSEAIICQVQSSSVRV